MAGDDSDKKSGGKRRVAAVTGAGRARLQVAAERQGVRWPARGMPHRGIGPGEWKQEGAVDETGFLPAECPVRPLGFEGESFYFVDTSGQVFNSGTNALSVERTQKLFAGHEDFLYWAWPSFGKGGKTISGFKNEEVRRDLFAACRSRGAWNMQDMVRGRGAWLTGDGRLVLHCGEYLWLDGRLADIGEVGEHFYVRRPAAIVPWAEPVEPADNPAVEIYQKLITWNLERGPTDAMLLLGWIGVAMLGATLDWRPSVFIVGEAGTGKSELVGKHGLLRTILGRSMIATTNASEAGLYQLVGHDSLPIGIDELEGDDNAEQAQKIIKMARDAASGSVRIRGGADHKGVEFQAQSTFLFSAITPPRIPAASLTRLAIIQLREFETSDGKVPKLEAAETVGPRLLRRIADHRGDFARRYDDYRDVLRAAGHDSRGQNTFGTFLAAAHLLLGDDGMEKLGLPWETLDHWGAALAAEIVPELADKKPSWLDCLDSLMTTPIDNYTHGTRQTIAQVLEELDNAELEPGVARHRLAAADVGLIDKGKCGDGWGLAIPTTSKVVGRMLLDTPYGHRGGDGSWSWALRRGPEAIVRKGIPVIGRDGMEKLGNRITVAGVQRRCSLVSLRDLKAWKAAQD